MNDWVNPYQQRIRNSPWIPEQDNIYSIGVAGSLYEWTQANGKSLFHFLDLEKLKNKKAILVIDYTIEGYDEPFCRLTVYLSLDSGSGLWYHFDNFDEMKQYTDISYFYETSALGELFGIDWSNQ